MEVNKLISELKTRWKQPTPPLFHKLGQLGLILAGIGGAILTAPVSLPLAMTNVAGYLLTAGTVLASISQITIE